MAEQLQFPVFVDPPSAALELANVRGADGQPTTKQVRFWPISSLAIFRLRALAAPAAKVVDAIATGQSAETRQAAIAEFIEAIGANPHLLALLILDGLQEPDPEQGKRIPTTKDCDAFLVATPGPALLSMLEGVLRVNGDAFRPFVDRLLGAALEKLKQALTSLTTSIQEVNSRAGSGS